MPIVATHELTPTDEWTPLDRLQIYNGLDCCVTVEVNQAIDREHNQLPAIYDFERALQAPYLEMMLRGWAIDQTARRAAAERQRLRMEGLCRKINLMAEAVWGKPLNANSSAQLKEFFYERMHLPEVWISQKGVRRISTNREALEKLDDYMLARPFISAILAVRDIGKQLSVFESEIDSDGRFRTSYNIAGTETGRPSSSTSAFGTGGNAQNIAPALRYVFIADPGYKLCSIDLEQVEARDVGFIEGCLFDDWKFLDACESGDLHTNNAKLVWPELPWTGDPKADRAIAERPFYREFSYRDMSKRGGHLSNYSGTAWTMARSLKIPLQVAEEFQARYCRGGDCAYPAHVLWWQWTAMQLQTTHSLVTLFGRRRHFFGRPNDDTTLREGIAFQPQGTNGDRMNLGLWRIWKHQPRVQLLGQGFDSVTFQAPDDDQFDGEVAKALEHVRVTINGPKGRRYTVPGEAKVGWNWGACGPANPDGLVKWRPGGDARSRTAPLQRLIQ